MLINMESFDFGRYIFRQYLFNNSFTIMDFSFYNGWKIFFSF
jgi:hypothetical protein